MWSTVFKCLKKQVQLEIDYQPPGQEVVARVFDPYHAVRYDGDWYVTGLCHTRGQIRTFSLSRIKKASPINEGFSIPDNFDFRKITSSRFGVHWGESEQQVEIMFSISVAPLIRERLWHPSQLIRTNSDDSIVLSLTVNHTLELKSWILSWGKDAQVLSPASLRNDIKNDIGSLSTLYGS